MPTPHEILAHHRTLHGALHYHHLDSDALGLRKPFYVYEPPGLATLDRVPLLYLFRGHEREWVNLAEDTSRRHTTAIEELDRRIAAGRLPPVVAVMPGLNSSNNHIPSLGIDMAGTWPSTARGLGTGRFWAFLTDDLFPHVAARYPQTAGGPRLSAGFSLGGYTASLLAVRCPASFTHVGLYDALLMWPGHRDPRVAAREDCTDPVWCRADLLAPALGRPRAPEVMRYWNATDRLRTAPPEVLAQVRRTTFWVASAAQDGRHGNVDRSRYFADLLRARQIPLGFREVVFHPDARHTWHWADRFLMRFLTAALVPTTQPR